MKGMEIGYGLENSSGGYSRSGPQVVLHQDSSDKVSTIFSYGLVNNIGSYVMMSLAQQVMPNVRVFNNPQGLYLFGALENAGKQETIDFMKEARTKLFKDLIENGPSEEVFQQAVADAKTQFFLLGEQVTSTTTKHMADAMMKQGMTPQEWGKRGQFLNNYTSENFKKFLKLNRGYMQPRLFISGNVSEQDIKDAGFRVMTVN